MNSMRVLDIDLDFFLSAPCPFAEEGKRPPDDSAEPWTEAAVREFLETNLGLQKSSPLPGRVFPTHEGALLYWQELIQKGLLTEGFTVTHVDTHSDLGIAQKGYPFVKMNVLGRPLPLRRDFGQFLELKQLNEANYLVFALGARMIGALENLRSPASLPDFPLEMAEGDGIRLHSAFPALFEVRYGREPLIPYRQYDDPFAYRAEGSYDFMSLALSPRYTPARADSLADILSEYMTF